MRKILPLLLALWTGIAKAQNIFSQHFKTTRSSAITDSVLHISGSDGKDAQIAVSMIKGAYPGPTFALMAGIHGMEYTPIISLREFSKDIDPARLHGNLIIIPLANEASFFGRTPFVNPQDGLNLNRVFPGKANGTITEAIAHFMTSELFPSIDILMDIHAGDVNEDLNPFICYYNSPDHPRQTSLASRLCMESGFKHIVSYPYNLKDHQPAMYAFKQALRQGVASLSIETGKLGNTNQEEIKQCKNAIFSILGALEMYDQRRGPAISKEVFSKQTYIPVPAKGLFFSSLKAGDRVKKGDLIGTIENVSGIRLATIRATESGMILYKIGTPPVNIGETLVCIASE